MGLLPILDKTPYDIIVDNECEIFINSKCCSQITEQYQPANKNHGWMWFTYCYNSSIFIKLLNEFIDNIITF